MSACSRRRTYNDRTFDHLRIQGHPIIGTLASHGEAQHDIDRVDVQPLGKQMMLGANAVMVVDCAGKSEGIRWAGRFTVSQQRDHNNPIITQCALAKIQGRTNPSAKACRKQSYLCRALIKLLICQANITESSTVLESKVGYVEEFDCVVRDGRHLDFTT